METTLIKHEQRHTTYDDLGYNDNWLYTLAGEEFTGTAYVYDFDNEDEWVVIGEIPFVKGNKSGLCRDWYPSGQLQAEFNIKDGAAHGLDREWYENGQLKSESLSEWSVTLYSKEWDEQGNLIKNYQLDKANTWYEILQKSRRIWGHEIDWEPQE